MFVYRTFIASVVLLLKHSNLKDVFKVIIDQEYNHKEFLLRSTFLEMWSRFFDKFPEVIFQRIGKSSGTHHIAYDTMRGKFKVDRKLNFEELKKLSLKFM